MENQTKHLSAKEIVLAFLDALNRFDYPAARKLVTDNLSFKGVLGERQGAEAYFPDMEKMRLQYEVLKSFEEDDDVTVWYNINMGKATVLTAGWYQLQDEKIKSIRVVFDPRPVIS